MIELDSGLIQTLPLEHRSAERTLRRVKVFLLVYCLFAVLSHIFMIYTRVQIGQSLADSFSVYTTLDLLLPIALIPFWMNRTIGWLLICAYFTYLAAFGFYDLGRIVDIWIMIADDATASPVYSVRLWFRLLSLLLYGFIGWMLFKKHTRDTFLVQRHTIFVALCTGVLILTTALIVSNWF